MENFSPFHVGGTEGQQKYCICYFFKTIIRVLLHELAAYKNDTHSISKKLNCKNGSRSDSQ